ncbi:helix-turn-helix domain-containing protein [Mangrovimonas sp. DI 80]|uniref:helix-turn-helix domain-containing protein n=1 Tax=Mangrovimonas sp. DI 80 TaxID=1779330 RepID=UPI00097725D1|nr:helix-turn-helix domain-containing protein [Mangrovimonas sp. DI 80]OMP30078.1 hypothetical protein BKM32_14465 [Mangrovimonas sp. DI 80]
MQITKRCTYCGKQFQAKTTKTQYCSHSCNRKDYKYESKKNRLKEVVGSGVEISISYKDQLEIVSLKDYLSIEDCSLLLNVSISTIKRLIKMDELASFNILSRVMIRRVDLEEYCYNELQKPKCKGAVVESGKDKSISFNKVHYYSMGEVTEFYCLSRRSVERHIKKNNINKIKKGRFTYVLKSDIKKLFGVPNK